MRTERLVGRWPPTRPRPTARLALVRAARLADPHGAIPRDAMPHERPREWRRYNIEPSVGSRDTAATTNRGLRLFGLGDARQPTLPGRGPPRAHASDVATSAPIYGESQDRQASA